jgi:hypothetical protein
MTSPVHNYRGRVLYSKNKRRKHPTVDDVFSDDEEFKINDDIIQHNDHLDQFEPETEPPLALDNLTTLELIDFGLNTEILDTPEMNHIDIDFDLFLHGAKLIQGSRNEVFYFIFVLYIMILYKINM